MGYLKSWDIRWLYQLESNLSNSSVLLIQPLPRLFFHSTGRSISYFISHAPHMHNYNLCTFQLTLWSELI